MKKILTTLFVVASTFISATAQSTIGINNIHPNASAALMVDTASTGPQGMLVPRMTQARRNAISSPAEGLMVYQTDNTPGFYYYNGTAWTGMNAGGGATLPSQTGNAGKALTTDGTSLSWGSSNSYELNVSKTAAEAQSTSVSSSLSLPDSITFSATNGANASLSGGNSWNGNRFSTGSNGAGLYFIDLQVTDVNTVAIIPSLDINNTMTANGGSATLTQGNSMYGVGLTNTSFPTGSKGRGHLTGVVWLNAGDVFKVRCVASTVIGNTPNTSGNTYLRVVRLR